MTTLQKTFIALTLAATIGTASYEAHQTSQLLEQIQLLQHQQAPLLEQIEKLQKQCDDAAKRASLLLEENAELRSGSHSEEIQKLRGEVARLEAVVAKNETNSTTPAVNTWLERVNQLKQYADQHPDESSPEFNFLTDREWLIVVDPEDKPIDFSDAMLALKSQAAGRFAQIVQAALQKYSLANNGQFPGDLSQLQPYCDAEVEEILQQRYEIKPASILPADSVRELNIKTDWVIAGKESVASNTADHIAIYPGGNSYFW
jgi:hypothetical protein